MRWRLNGFQECWLHFYVCVFDVLCSPMNIQISHFSCVANLAVCLLLLVWCFFSLFSRLCSRHSRPGAELHVCVCLTDSFDFFFQVFYHAFARTHTELLLERACNPKAVWMYKIANVCILYMHCTHTQTHTVHIYDAILIVWMNETASVWTLYIA